MVKIVQQSVPLYVVFLGGYRMCLGTASGLYARVGQVLAALLPHQRRIFDVQGFVDRIHHVAAATGHWINNHKNVYTHSDRSTGAKQTEISDKHESAYFLGC